MAKKEDILRAEEQINDILESLSKMKKAADMLEGAQKNTAEVISTSEELVKQIAILTSNAQKILNNLDNQDVLEEIKGMLSQHHFCFENQLYNDEWPFDLGCSTFQFYHLKQKLYRESYSNVAYLGNQPRIYNYL